MPKRAAPQIVTNADDAVANITKFAKELAASDVIQSRLGYVQSWYAVRRTNGEWAFGPSKFVGYRDNDAGKYIAFTGRPFESDGRDTERALESWFETVDSDAGLGRELTKALEAFLAAWAKRPNARVRINVLKSELAGRPAAERGAADMQLLNRIASDPRICGGRPCIKGTRMRVSDILDMLAAGATKAQILRDFPYIIDEDISASLAFAARASDHRIIRAA